jgi:hypothetical protein
MCKYPVSGATTKKRKKKPNRVKSTVDGVVLVAWRAKAKNEGNWERDGHRTLRRVLREVHGSLGDHRLLQHLRANSIRGGRPRKKGLGKHG